jgi:thioredoxin-like negative regulator of GroEL
MVRLDIKLPEQPPSDVMENIGMSIDDIKVEYKEKHWLTIERDEFPEIAGRQTVMGIPSLLVLKYGEKLAHLHGPNAKTPEAVREFLNALYFI